MRAGQLRKQVTIQSQPDPLASQTSTGAPDPTWSDWATEVSCAVEPQNGREFIAAQQLNAEITHLLTIRYLKGFTAVRKRVVLEGRILRVIAVLDLEERHREMQVQCKELAS